MKLLVIYEYDQSYSAPYRAWARVGSENVSIYSFHSFEDAKRLLIEAVRIELEKLSRPIPDIPESEEIEIEVTSAVNG